MCPRSVVLAVAIASGALLASPGSAVDGVIEINQAKALAGGVTPGDGPGFPVTINAGGSYRLTSNLVAPEATSGIQVQVGGVAADPKVVDIDLNGFTIAGPISCTFVESLSCSAPTGSGTGVDVLAGFVRVHDGTVQGFAMHCIDNSLTQTTIQLRNLDLKWCHFGANAHHGVLENINIAQNRSAGLFASRSVLRGIHSQQNDGDGINISESTLDGCTSSYNLGHGIVASIGSLVHRCVSFSGLAATSYGLNCAGGCGYSGNSFFDFPNDQFVANGTELGENLCGTTLCTP